MENLGGYDVVDGIRVADIRLREKHVLIRWLKKEETKGGIILPQNRQRAGFMKGVVLAICDGFDEKLSVGDEVEFNGQGEKEWLGDQCPPDRDTVFFTRVENLFARIKRDEDGNASLDMLGRWVMVRPFLGNAETSSGLIITEKSRENEARTRNGGTGTVLGVGGKVCSCVVGDGIAYESDMAVVLHLGDHNAEKVLLIDDEAVIGVEEKEGVAG